MPSRIIKESICTSDSLDQLSFFQETFFYRLIVNCDDYGRMDARPKILASKLFPLKDIRETQIQDALRALTSAELVILYQVDGKPFLQMKTWDRHQQIRAKKSKYPAFDSTCNQIISDDIKCPRNPIQSESNPNPNPESESNAHAREDAAADDVGMPFGSTEDKAIEKAAKAWGLPCHEGNMLKARDMARDYTLEWLLKAIEEAGNHGAGWPYVASVLRNWKAKGGPEACKEDPRKRIGKQVIAQQYQQRTYTEEELEAVGGNLLEEYKAARDKERDRDGHQL